MNLTVEQLHRKKNELYNAGGFDGPYSDNLREVLKRLEELKRVDESTEIHPEGHPTRVSATDKETAKPFVTRATKAATAEPKSNANKTYNTVDFFRCLAILLRGLVFIVHLILISVFGFLVINSVATILGAIYFEEYDWRDGLFGDYSGHIWTLP